MATLALAHRAAKSASRVSIGLSGNKFLAKLASRTGQAARLRRDRHGGSRSPSCATSRSASSAAPARCWQARLERDGIATIGQLQDADPRDLANRYGATGLWLARMAHAQDGRAGGSRRRDEDHFVRNHLRQRSVAAGRTGKHAVAAGRTGFAPAPRPTGLAGRTMVLKLKTADFRLRTRSASLDAPTQLADRIFRTAQAALKREADGTRFRLLGVGLSNLAAGRRGRSRQPDRSASATSAPRRSGRWTRSAPNSAAKRSAKAGV